MKKGKASRTSEGTVAVRARETRRPAGERLFSDPYAEHFLSPFFLFLKSHPLLGQAFRWFYEKRRPGISGGIIARTRYFDEETAAALKEGVAQIVILGAGYDSRGYRLVSPGDGITVFEVDHPATQARKAARLRELMAVLPPHVVFVPVDFGSDDLREKMREAGYSREKKTLFLWEGVIYYLTAAAVDEILTFVAGESGEGSSIVFDYFPRSVVDGTHHSREAKNLRRFLKRLGEPLLFGLDDEEAEIFLRERGFGRVEMTTSRACREAWFQGVNSGICVSDVFRFVHAKR